MLGYVNEVRKQYGLRELEGLELLDSAADVRANELLENYSHDRPDGNSYITAIEETDLPEWRAAAENIAYGMNSMTTVKEAFDAWMDSPQHRDNILNPDVRYMRKSYKVGQRGIHLLGTAFLQRHIKKLDRLFEPVQFFLFHVEHFILPAFPMVSL